MLPVQANLDSTVQIQDSCNCSCCPRTMKTPIFRRTPKKTVDPNVKRLYTGRNATVDLVELSDAGRAMIKADEQKSKCTIV